MQGPAFDEVIARAEGMPARGRRRARGRGVRSEAYLWMQRNRARLEREVGRLGWERIAAALAAEGMRDAEGGALTPASLRRTWSRVCEAARREAAAAEAKRRRRAMDAWAEPAGTRGVPADPHPAVAAASSAAPEGGGEPSPGEGNPYEENFLRILRERSPKT